MGQRWLWRFDYPQTPTSRRTPPSPTTSSSSPSTRTVILHITSTDVDHRWFVPALGGQVEAVPGQESDTWFRADRTGVYPGQSTAFSGTSYAVMRAWVKVVSPQQYQQFIKQKRREIAAAQALRAEGRTARRGDGGGQRHEPSHRSGPGPAGGRHRASAAAATRSGSSAPRPPTTSRWGSSTSAPPCSSPPSRWSGSCCSECS